MKTPTRLDAIDTSWQWPTYEKVEWHDGRLGLDPSKMTPEELWEDNPLWYRPLREHTALFIEFSQTSKSKAGILKFAQAYGLIERNDSTEEVWKQSIIEMGVAVAAWRAVEGGANAESLRLVLMRLLPERYPLRGNLRGKQWPKVRQSSWETASANCKFLSIEGLQHTQHLRNSYSRGIRIFSLHFDPKAC